MASNKRRKYSKREKIKKVDFKVGILLIIASLILGVSLVLPKEAGTFGIWLKNIITGTFGSISYVLPLLFFLFGVCILAEKSLNTKVAGCYVSLLLCVSCFIYLFSEYLIYDNEIGFWDNIALIYDYEKFFSGGAIAGVISIPLINVFGMVVTFVLYIIWLAITLSLISDRFMNTVIDNTTNASKWMIDKMNIDRINSPKQSTKKIGQTAYNQDYIGESELENNVKVAKKGKIKDFFKNEDSKNKEILDTDNEIIINDGNAEKVVDVEIPAFVSNHKESVNNTKSDVNEKSFDIDMFSEEEDDSKKENKKPLKLNIEHSELKEIQSNYKFPPIDLLKDPVNKSTNNGKELRATAIKLENTLKSFGVDVKILNVSKGPTITRYELSPAVGVKVSKIIGLSDDIALNLAVSSIRIAPIEGKSAIGIEVPNKENDSVSIKEILASDKFKEAKSNLSFAVGKNIAGDIVIGDVSKMPHMLVAGSTGSGKSVCINTLITSILYKARPDQVKFIMIDPKVVELGVYNGIPHLLIPVVTDPRKAAGALQWAVQEMVNRYNLFAEKGVRDLKGYNTLLKEEGQEGVLPHVIIIIDELSDLMMVAPNDVEDAICRLAQMARAAGMHLVVATQRPSVDVVTGLIKANIPSRIAFAVSSQVDSRTILDMAGAEKLLGKGDMLYYPTGESKPIRLQGPFVSDKEIENVTDYLKKQASIVEYDQDIIEKIEAGAATGSGKGSSGNSSESDVDPLLTSAIGMIVDSGQASASIIQRRFKVGYNRAARMIDEIQERGIISGPEGSKPRKVLISKEQWENMKEQGEI